MNDIAELIEAFRSESEEILDRVEELLLALEQSPGDDELLHEIFRGAHTIKGNAACLQYDDLTAFAHVVEEVLENLRNGTAHPTPSCISGLLDAVDAMRDLSARAIAGNGAMTEQQRALASSLSGAATPFVSQQPGNPASQQLRTQTLRVSTTKLDRMLDLTGEIAIARGHVRQLAAGEERLLDAIRDLDRLSFDLQELVMSARMVPLAPALRPFQRVVRDVSAAREKQAALVIEAGDVEVDTTVIEHLRDPITHMLRNAIDHGIELPAARLEAGKPAVGTIRITASHDGSGIVITIADDGQGLDEERIARRAVELGIEPGRNAIFEPGFSTASAVTDLSGRGVGMDVVRRNVESLRGTISVASERGTGTTITIRLPLTLTVIEGFGVEVGGETYVIPIESVAECIALPRTSADEAFGVLNIRGEVLPFLRLRELFGIDGDARPRENVVVVQHEGSRAGIVVDELLGASDTVMKPMGGLLRQAPGVAGSSILGNGRVALVLDAREIVRCAVRSQLTQQQGA